MNFADELLHEYTSPLLSAAPSRVYTCFIAFPANNPNDRRCTMTVSQAIDFHLQYHRANSKKNTVKTCELVLSRFAFQFGKRDLVSIIAEEVLSPRPYQRQQTGHEKEPLLGTCILLQLHQQHRPPRTQ